jgi:hypothetical protein
MVSLEIRHLVVLDISDRPSGVVSMAELFDVLVRSQEPMALYAKFADIMLHSGDTATPGTRPRSETKGGSDPTK